MKNIVNTIMKRIRRIMHNYYLRQAAKAGLIDRYGFTKQQTWIKGLGYASFPYSANGGKLCMTRNLDWWVRVRAVSDKNRQWVIKCDQCQKDAVSIGHHYPSDWAACEDHFGKEVIKYLAKNSLKWKKIV